MHRIIFGTTVSVLTIPTGYTSAYGQLSSEAKEEHKTSHSWPGIAQSSETVKWLWENQFAAVAADNPAFDCVRKCFFPDGLMVFPFQLDTSTSWLTCLQLPSIPSTSYIQSSWQAGAPQSGNSLTSMPLHRHVRS